MPCVLLDNSPKTLNDYNQQASFQRFRQLISKTLFSILVNFNSAVVMSVLILLKFSGCPALFSRFLNIAPSIPLMISITVTFTVHAVIS